MTFNRYCGFVYSLVSWILWQATYLRPFVRNSLHSDLIVACLSLNEGAASTVPSLPAMTSSLGLLYTEYAYIYSALPMVANCNTLTADVRHYFALLCPGSPRLGTCWSFFFFTLLHQQADDEAPTRLRQTSMFLVASPILVKSMCFSFRSIQACVFDDEQTKLCGLFRPL